MSNDDVVVVVVVVVVVGSWEAGVERRQMGTILEKMFVQSSHQSYKSKGLKLNSTQRRNRKSTTLTLILSDFRSEGMFEIDELERGSLFELLRKDIAL